MAADSKYLDVWPCSPEQAQQLKLRRNKVPDTTSARWSALGFEAFPESLCLDEFPSSRIISWTPSMEEKPTLGPVEVEENEEVLNKEAMAAKSSEGDNNESEDDEEDVQKSEKRRKDQPQLQHLQGRAPQKFEVVQPEPQPPHPQGEHQFEVVPAKSQPHQEFDSVERDAKEECDFEEESESVSEEECDFEEESEFASHYSVERVDNANCSSSTTNSTQTQNSMHDVFHTSTRKCYDWPLWPICEIGCTACVDYSCKNGTEGKSKFGLESLFLYSDAVRDNGTIAIHNFRTKKLQISRIVLKHYFRQSGRRRKMKIMSSALKRQVLYYKLFKEFCKCNESDYYESSYFIETDLPNYSIDIAKQLEAGITEFILSGEPTPVKTYENGTDNNVFVEGEENTQSSVLLPSESNSSTSSMINNLQCETVLQKHRSVSSDTVYKICRFIFECQAAQRLYPTNHYYNTVLDSDLRAEYCTEKSFLEGQQHKRLTAEEQYVWNRVVPFMLSTPRVHLEKGMGYHYWVFSLNSRTSSA
jgi:hypothetical protein